MNLQVEHTECVNSATEQHTRRQRAVALGQLVALESRTHRRRSRCERPGRFPVDPIGWSTSTLHRTKRDWRPCAAASNAVARSVKTLVRPDGAASRNGKYSSLPRPPQEREERFSIRFLSRMIDLSTRARANERSGKWVAVFHLTVVRRTYALTSVCKYSHDRDFRSSPNRKPELTSAAHVDSTQRPISKH